MNKQSFINRRNMLRQLMLEKGAEGHIILFGNNEVPYNYKANLFDYFRQDSTFRYYFGLNEPALAGVIDLETGENTLIGKKPGKGDIVWSGPQLSVKELADTVGVDSVIENEGLIIPAYPVIHLLPAYRDDIKAVIGEFFHDEEPSLKLIEAVVGMRSVKDADEIAHLDEIQNVSYKMLAKAKSLAFDGISEQTIVAELTKIVRIHGGNFSFPPIVSVNGHILHNPHHKNILKMGDLLVVDIGYESPEGYCTDHTRTFPVGGRFTSQQEEIYDIVLSAKNDVYLAAGPGWYYKEMHSLAALTIAKGLKKIGLMKGSSTGAVHAGAHALFFPHGLGHMMGMDVHDMENLGEDFVGYDSTVKRSEQFGLAYLRMARKLQPGFVVTNEPGIYFNPHLIDIWKAEGKFAEYINYEEVEKYRNFGGIRLEDDLYITETGCRYLGSKQFPE